MRGISCKRALEVEAKERDAVHRAGKTVEVGNEIAEEVYRLHKIIDIQAERLCELDEKNQTQAKVLAARDKIIQQQVCIQHAYRDEMAALKKDLAASRRCGSCRHWDEKAHRCCNSNSQLFSVLSVLRYETCDGWDNLQNLHKQRDSE